MKQMKKLSALAAGSIATGLLLGASMAQAAEVCWDGDIVSGIKGLDVVTETLDFITIDVDFVNATGFEMYGSELDQNNFPYSGALAEQDALATTRAINVAINEINGVPDFVEISGKKNYYIGVEGEYERPLGLVGAIGGENVTGDNWDLCNESSVENCVVGVVVLKADEQFIYADLSKADGNDCGNAPPQNPPDSVSITPGFSGSWYDVAREGEGFNIEIGGSELDPYLLTYFYTYDKSGNQMWLTGFASINSSDTVVVDMEVTSGTVWGDGFDPDDVNYNPWGTITFRFSSCNAGTAEYASSEFGSGTFNIVHLTGIAGLSCP
jgi:hypothetical protein